MDRAASSRPERPGPGDHVRLRLGRVGGERAELRVPRCGAVRTPKASPRVPAQPTGSPLDDPQFSAPRGELRPGATRGPLRPPLWTRSGGEAGVQAIFKPCFPSYLPLGAVQVPGHLGKRQTLTSCHFSPVSGRAERCLPQSPLGLLSGNRHLAPSHETWET